MNYRWRLSEVCSDKPEDEYEERSKFEERYYALMAQARNLLCSDGAADDGRSVAGSICKQAGHPESECRMGPCRERGCTERHNSLLHRPSSSSSHLALIDEQDENEIIVNYSNHNTNQVLLSTAIIEVSNPVDHQKVKVRALLDCGSQSSFISESLKTRLSLKSRHIDTLKVIGVGNTSSMNVIESCNIQLKATNSNFSAMLSCFVLNELTGRLPKTPVVIKSIKLPENIQLADPIFYQPAPIDVLIGADLFWDILGNEQRSLGPNNPKLRSSQLGWIISGPINSAVSMNRIHCNHAIVSSSQNENIEQLVSKFWELEEVPKKSIISEDESECERHFLANTIRDEEASEYTEFIREYAELRHLSVSKYNSSPVPPPAYYLCHHAVIRQESESTKLRVVFDGSAYNGTNLVAAARELRSFIKQNQNSLFDFASQKSVQFKFISAYSPHFGGIWEAGVKSAKFHLKRVVGNSHLTFEELNTLFTQVEAILNSRPLCPLSSSPNDLLSLSPGHFLIGRPLTAPPSQHLGDSKESTLQRYERLEKMQQHFWQRWQREYLSEMQQRTKWKSSTSKLDIGDMVLLADDNAPPLSWKLGRVLRLITGSDGTARVADITTNKGCVCRSLARLCKLPTAEELQVESVLSTAGRMFRLAPAQILRRSTVARELPSHASGACVFFIQIGREFVTCPEIIVPLTSIF
ncbi:uncharacterized protein LOC123722703 [Papilio machaon]|uniref:uncharacterized protein LOC123722703 n=1 Tax=Papilio machaon TaxID=76193 RepID=UPI001E6632A3|nr:uncharacterized protein LOC123722703 [Papilio machaon]